MTSLLDKLPPDGKRTTTLNDLALQLYHQLDLPARTERKDLETILRALEEAQSIPRKEGKWFRVDGMNQGWLRFVGRDIEFCPDKVPPK